VVGRRVCKDRPRLVILPSTRIPVEHAPWSLLKNFVLRFLPLGFMVCSHFCLSAASAFCFAGTLSFSF
jgi:hypothetical protein